MKPPFLAEGEAIADMIDSVERSATVEGSLRTGRTGAKRP